MKAKRRCLPNFEARSLMIIAAWAVGSAAAVHAQTPYSPPPRPGAPMTTPSGGGTAAPRAAPTAGASEDAGAAFMRADTNHDGKLSHEEADAIPALAQRFEQIDTNHDGFISREEYDKAMR